VDFPWQAPALEPPAPRRSALCGGPGPAGAGPAGPGLSPKIRRLHPLDVRLKPCEKALERKRSPHYFTARGFERWNSHLISDSEK